MIHTSKWCFKIRSTPITIASDNRSVELKILNKNHWITTPELPCNYFKTKQKIFQELIHCTQSNHFHQSLLTIKKVTIFFKTQLKRGNFSTINGDFFQQLLAIELQTHLAETFFSIEKISAKLCIKTYVELQTFNLVRQISSSWLNEKTSFMKISNMGFCYRFLYSGCRCWKT